MEIYSRNLPGIQDKLKQGQVAIAGLGGLGSNIAVMLARIGVGRLFLVDFDKVEESNLNRQHYNNFHVGMAKTEALKAQIRQINTNIEVRTLTARITAENAASIFAEYKIVCEAFDKAESKADFVNALVAEGDKKIVAASGMNGVGGSNTITTKHRLRNLYICGDGVEAEEDGIGFMAPRVMICAGHQANMITRLILGMNGVGRSS